jgi:serine protease Do
MNKQKILVIFFIILGTVFAIEGGFLVFKNFLVNQGIAQNLQLDDQEATVRSIKKVLPAVVSISVYELATTNLIDLSTGETVQKNEKVSKGSGTGFLISADGLIITNKHVVDASTSKSSEYRVVLSNGKKYYAQVIGRDPLNDLAVIKIFDKNLPFIELGDSDKMPIGSTVIAIGNVLGKYDNTVTKGIISGLGRTVEGSDQAGNVESLDNVIQTDAEINPGNSGGPLIDLNGKVIGINVAIDQSGQSIGFAIPINDAKTVIQSVREIGRIVRPRLGIRYTMLDADIAGANNLKRTYGAWVVKDPTTNVPAVLPGSPAEKAGILEGDIIYEIDGLKIDGKNTLLSVLQKRKPGQRVGFKIDRGGKILTLIAVLDEFRE